MRRLYSIFFSLTCYSIFLSGQSIRIDCEMVIELINQQIFRDQFFGGNAPIGSVNLVDTLGYVLPCNKNGSDNDISIIRVLPPTQDNRKYVMLCNVKRARKDHIFTFFKPKNGADLVIAIRKKSFFRRKHKIRIIGYGAY
jgi:hypothetical protein